MHSRLPLVPPFCHLDLPSLSKRLRGGESRVDVTDLDVGEGDGGARRVGFDIGGNSRVGGAGTTGDASLGGSGGGWVGAVEPQSIGLMVVPDGQGEDHTSLQSRAHLGETALGSELVVVTKGGLLLATEGVGDLVGGSDAGPGAHGVGDDLSVLDVEALDGAERSAGRVVTGNELGNDSYLLGSVDSHALAEEVLVTHAVGVEVTSVLVANTTVSRRSVTTICAGAAGLPANTARVGGVGRRDRVSLPDVHLRTACSVLTSSGIGIIS